MIITLFVVFLILSILLIFAGHYTETPPLSLAGYLFLFILGIAVMFSGIMYNEGISYNYVCACCENGTYNEGAVTPIYDYSCVGTPFDCSYYNEQEANCIIAGCSYDNETLNCSGTPEDCDTRTEERDCEAINCTWQQGQEYTLTGCANTSSLTLKNTTAIYSSYTGEAGITTTHFIGFFIAIIGVLGWIIVFMNLKSGKESYGTWNKKE